MTQTITILIGLIFLTPCLGQETRTKSTDTTRFDITIDQKDQHEIQFGTYGVYWDWSTYTELVIKENQTFEYIDRDFSGIGFKNYGKWKIQKGILILYDYVENNSNGLMPTIWKIKEKELCNITKKHKRKGLCVALKK